MIIGTESETVEFKESTGETHVALEAIAAILNKRLSKSDFFRIQFDFSQFNYKGNFCY